MNVEQLIELLSKYPKDHKVMFELLDGNVLEIEDVRQQVEEEVVLIR